MLQDAIRHALPQLRAEAQARMTSRVTVRRKTGAMVQDEDTGLEVPEWTTVHTDLPFRLAGSSTGDGGTRTVNIGGVEYQRATGVGHFPHDAELADSDHVEITAGDWVGATFLVVEASRKDQSTARRVPVVEVSRPEEWS